MHILGPIAHGIAIIATAILVWGVLVGLFELVQLECLRIKGQNIRRQRNLIRQDVGYYILLGLEFLIAADIIKTVVNPELQELAVLGATVAIRTVINFFLVREVGTAEDKAPAEQPTE